MQRRRQQILFFSLVSILIIFMLSGCRAAKWNLADFSSSTKVGKTLQRLAERLQPGKSTRSEIERDICGSWDSYYVVRYLDIETRTAMLSQSNQEPLRQYFCPKVDNVRMVYDAGGVMQAVVYDPSIIQSERKGSAKDLPIRDVIDTFGRPSIVYESEGTVFFAYPSKGVEVRLWKEFDLTDSSFDPYSWPEHFPESTYAEYVLLFAPMTDSQFREIYMGQYSPYKDVDWQGIGN